MRVSEPFYRLTGQLERRYNRQWISGKRPVILPWNRTNNAIFVHIPKTAGTSLLRLLDIDPPQGYMTHIPARIYHRFDPDLWNRSYKFTCVRDPADRFVSIFYFLRDHTVWPLQTAWASKHLAGLEFPDFVEKVRTEFIYRQIVMSNPFFWPQCHYLKFRGGYARLDDIYRFENLNEDAKRLCQRLGLAWTCMPHERKGAHPDHKDLLDRDAYALIGRLYRSDYTHFGYNFPL